MSAAAGGNDFLHMDNGCHDAIFRRPVCHRRRMSMRTTGLAVSLLAALAAAPAFAQNDPHQWLEGVEDQKALDWVKTLNDDSVDELSRAGDFKRMEASTRAILDSDDKIAFVDKMGDYYYNFWRDAEHQRGLWRRTTLTEYRKAEPTWETILDLDALATEEKENWVFAGSSCLPPTYERCLLQLSRGGADADVVREFDIPSKSFVKGGFELPEAKSQIAWVNLDEVLVGTDFGPGSMTTSGYARIAKRWRRGTPIAAAEVVYEGKPDDVWVWAFSDLTKGYERQGILRGTSFYTNELYLLVDGKPVKIDKQDSANASAYREWLLIELREAWNVGGQSYPAGALLATKLDAFLKGERRFDVLFQPSERKSLAGFSPTRNHVILNELDNVKNRLYVLTYANGEWKREAMTGLPEFGTISADAIDPEESDAYFLTVTDFLTPTTLYIGEVGKGLPEKLKSTPAFFDASGLTVSQHEAKSADGTLIPYFQVGPKDLPLNGKNPTVLYGYGGFEVSMTPTYSAATGENWLTKGGVYVVANIRGGGEFGPKWHQAALKANRNKAYEDFIAVAEDLIARKVTSTPHLGIQGGSNGGLLMGNMLTMRPDLFGAIVCQVPLLDMQRYHTLLAGASWMAEYGDPDKPEEWAFLKQYSPYHNVKADVKYPRTLFTTSTRDDRVHPGHARKMVAKMKEQGHDVLYYENVEGGHGGAANNAQRAFMTALAWTFFARELR
jgi:prolyl oligopeptidase